MVDIMTGAIEKGFDKVNMCYGIVTAPVAVALGKNWFLFAFFLVLNVADYFTGIVKARKLKKESSKIGAEGVVKKVCYWVVIAIAFGVASCFKIMGTRIGINLAFTELFGWFTLATYLVNELRSIFENLKEMDVPVPEFLVKGLAITDKLIEESTDLQLDASTNSQEKVIRPEGGVHDGKI